MPLQDAERVVKATQHVLDDSNEFSAHHLRLLLSTPPQPSNVSSSTGQHDTAARTAMYQEHGDEDTALLLKLVPMDGASAPRSELHPYSPTLDVFYAPNQIPSSSSTSSPLATFIAKELQKLFTEEQATLAYLLSSSPATQITQIKSLSPESAATLARRTTRSFKYAPTYHLTFSLFTSTATPSAWNIEAALADYFAPLLESLSSISNFTVDTQVQVYAAFSPSIREPEYDPERDAWALRREDLSGFINAAEWPLSPSIGEGPTVNFVIYVPEKSHSPLVIAENGGNSWLVPQWGGVLILNPERALGSVSALPDILTKDALRPAMQVFSNQLLSLLGLPHSPPSLPLRISTLTRERAASLIFSASSTMGALARLTRALTSIAIPDTVARNVDLTILHLHSACSDLREGKFHSALENARVAEAEAEKAFFERSMVGQVYFPDEHKVAVYLPFLGPVAVPLIMAALKEVKSMRNRKSKME